MSDEAGRTEDGSLDDNTPDPENELAAEEPAVDTAETGLVPPDRWTAAQGFGNTPAEEEEGESLDRRLAQEVPDTQPGEVDDRWAEGPAPRSGRLLAPDEGAHPDDEPDAVAQDVGIDGDAAGAEEAAVHLIPDEDDSVREDLPDEELDELLGRDSPDDGRQ
jgi:uncharacterized protein DUF5709